MSDLVDPFILIPTISLVAQLFVLGLLIYGYLLKRRLDFQSHGRIMSTALVLHLILILAIMVPSFVFAIIPQYLLRNIFGTTSIVSLIHVPLGLIAVSLGLWLSVAWRFNGLRSCFSRKRFMLPTMTAWIASLSFGIIFYVILVISLLKG